MKLPGRDTALLLLVAVLFLALHTFFNAHYGFHRDELATISDAKRLALGYVAYPPVTPFFARLSLTFFGDSLRGLRFFPALALTASALLAAFIARELGGRLKAQLLTLLAVLTAPLVAVQSSMIQYVSFDYLWWVLLAYLVVRLINTDDSRLWIAIGTVIGLGMQTKYTMGLLALGIVAAVLFTPLRRHLATKWLWIGVALSILIWIPNILWQAQHHFISLEFLRSIHERDVRIGRTKDFWIEQLYIPAAPFFVPLWIAGLWWLFFGRDGRRYRALAIIFLVTIALFALAKGRGYYTSALYPMPLAAASVVFIRWTESLRRSRTVLLQAAVAVIALVAVVSSFVFFSPSSAINTKRFALIGDWAEEVGWPELVDTVASVYESIPAEEKSRAGILAANYGEAGAIEVYGSAKGLPAPISGVNSFYYRGYGNAPQTLVVVGYSQRFRERNFESCVLAARFKNHYSVANEETNDHPEIYLCRNLKQTWPDFWSDFHYFG